VTSILVALLVGLRCQQRSGTRAQFSLPCTSQLRPRSVIFEEFCPDVSHFEMICTRFCMVSETVRKNV
jgi:hypothetical protein